MPTTDASVYPDPFTSVEPRHPLAPQATFTRDVLAAEYAVRSTHPRVLAELVAGFHPWERRWSDRARCWYIASWVVDLLAAALDMRGFIVTVKDDHHRPVRARGGGVRPPP